MVVRTGEKDSIVYYVYKYKRYLILLLCQLMSFTLLCINVSQSGFFKKVFKLMKQKQKQKSYKYVNVKLREVINLMGSGWEGGGATD